MKVLATALITFLLASPYGMAQGLPGSDYMPKEILGRGYTAEEITALNAEINRRRIIGLTSIILALSSIGFAIYRHRRNSWRTTSKIFLLISLTFLITPGTTLAQGLKGVPSCGRSAYQPTRLIAGKTDNERWARFFSIQPKLIGMKAESVEKALGFATSSGTNSELYYQITESKEPNRKGALASVALEITLEKGIVKSFKVEGIYWG